MNGGAARKTPWSLLKRWRSRTRLDRRNSGVFSKAFRLTWMSAASSTLGVQMAGVAYPLLALKLDHPPFAVTWVSFAWFFPNLVFNFFAGHLVDRHGPRRVMFLAEALRLVLIAGTLVALVFHRPETYQLAAIAALEGTLVVFSSLSATTRVPTLVRGNGLKTALVRSEAAIHLAVLVGRPLSITLFAVSPIAPFAANLVLCLCSLIAIRLAVAEKSSDGDRRVRMEADASRAGLLSYLPDAESGIVATSKQFGSGFREIGRLPYLTAVTALTTLTNMVCSAVLIIFLSQKGVLAEWVVGGVVAATGLGGVCGSWLASQDKNVSRLLGWRRRGRSEFRISTFLVHAWIWVAALVLLVISHDPVVYAVALFLMGLAGGRSNITLGAYVGTQVPEEVLGRVNSTMRVFGAGSTALGTIIGGFLLNLFEEQISFTVMAAGLSVMAALITIPRELRARFYPEVPSASAAPLPVDAHAPLGNVLPARDGDRPGGQVTVIAGTADPGLVIAVAEPLRPARSVAAADSGGGFDFDAHAGVGEAAGEHGGGGAYVAEECAEDRPARLEVGGVGEDVADADHVGQGGTGFEQGGFDVAQGLARLVPHVVGDGHGGVVEAGGA
jgi:MFS family permease